MEFTINQIKEKQKTLKTEINELLHKFHSETELQINGQIHFGHTDEKDQHWTSLNYSNPFN